MRSTSAVRTALLLATTSALAFCPIEYQDCSNGMFNPTTCKCDCIPPYCPDASGDCNNPTGFCGGNPWSSCTRGLDCPWWSNPLKAETCTTGTIVPAGIWKVYPNAETCCDLNFPYSAVCTQNVPIWSVSAPTAQPMATIMTTNPTTMVSEFETIYLRFSLMGIPTDMNDIRDFKDVMMEELKSIISDVADKIDMKVTGLREIYDLNVSAKRALQSEKRTETLHLYYDLEVISNPSQRYAPVLIQALRQQHGLVLQSLQEYNDAKTYYYMTNFDLCTTSAIKGSSTSFDTCTLDHELIKVKFSASNLDPSLDQNEFNEELLKIFKGILNKIDGLDLVDIELGEMTDTSYGTDVYFNIDVIDSGDDNWKKMVETELEKDATKLEIIDQLQKYTIKSLEEDGGNIEDVNWCFDKQGVFSMNCNAVRNNGSLPMWAIIVIATTAGAIFLCLLITFYVYMRQNAKDDEDIKHNFQSYIADPKQWRQSQIDGQNRHSAAYAATRFRPRHRQEGDDRHEKARRRHPKKERSYRKYTRSFRRKRRPHEQNHSSHGPSRRHSPVRKQKHHETQETKQDEENLQLLALMPPQYEYIEPYYPESTQQNELLALPAPDYYASDNALYCDDEEVNRPDPPMQAGPTAIEQQQQQEQKRQQEQPEGLLMLADGRASDSSEDNTPILAIEPDGHRASFLVDDSLNGDTS